jgi:hypothetical protein
MVERFSGEVWWRDPAEAQRRREDIKNVNMSAYIIVFNYFIICVSASPRLRVSASLRLCGISGLDLSPSS